MQSTYGKRIQSALALGSMLDKNFNNLDAMISRGYIECKRGKYTVTLKALEIVKYENYMYNKVYSALYMEKIA